MNKEIDLKDSIISEIEYAIGVFLNDNSKAIKNNEDSKLTKADINKSIKNIRVNHTGEICAQALYRGQALFTSDKKIKMKLYEMCNEEHGHLDLCNQRLKELKGYQSIFNPVWYSASFCLGVVAGLNEDKWKLGFIEETEKQVEEHLTIFANKLPINDKRSKKILNKIAQDEKKHRHTANNIGSEELPSHVKKGMDIFSKIMKKLSYYI